MKRGLLHYILAGAALGLAIPLGLKMVSVLLDSFEGVPDLVRTVFDNVQLMLWPTPLLLIPVEEPGAPDLSVWGTFAAATLANITVYSAIAGLVWMSLVKSRLFWALPLLAVAGTWYVVWRI
jgi:hypothetical protein